MTRVLLVDDHQLIRSGLATLLEPADDLEVVGEAANGAEAVDLAARTSPDVVLMDLSMPVMDGVEATRRILEHRPQIAVVVLTSFADKARVTDAIEAGAVGYLLKDSEPSDLLAAIRSAAAGHAPLDPRIARTLLPSAPATDPAAALSVRERQVLKLVCKGLANKQIGRELGISEHTVKVHLGNVFRQIGVGDRTSAALWARDHFPAE
jgi:DNA-binding NarL/FixJ family response regulator